LYRLALEQGKAGNVFHGVADEGVLTRELAEVIAQRTGLPAVSKTLEEVGASLGFLGAVLGMDGASTSARTREQLGWRPSEVGLLADLQHGTYFDA
jgi:nucleoside-diphosphate-sugar epimerase